MSCKVCFWKHPVWWMRLKWCSYLLRRRFKQIEKEWIREWRKGYRIVSAGGNDYELKKPG